MKNFIHYFACALTAMLLLGSCTKDESPESTVPPEHPIVGSWEKSSYSYLFDEKVIGKVAPGVFFVEDYFTGYDFYANGIVLQHADPWSRTFNYFVKESDLFIDESQMKIACLDEKVLTIQDSKNPYYRKLGDLKPVANYHGKEILERKLSGEVQYFYKESDHLIRCKKIPDGEGYYDAFQYGFVRVK